MNDVRTASHIQSLSEDKEAKEEEEGKKKRTEIVGFFSFLILVFLFVEPTCNFASLDTFPWVSIFSYDFFSSLLFSCRVSFLLILCVLCAL